MQVKKRAQKMWTKGETKPIKNDKTRQKIL